MSYRPFLTGSRGQRSRPRAPRWLLLASLVLVVYAGLAAGRDRPSFGQTEEAEAMIRKGLELRHQGKDAQAVPYLEKAYGISRTPRTAAQLGLVRMALGYWVDAERYLDEALADPDNPWIAQNRNVLEAARTRVRGLVADLTITGEPAGAEVVINGHAIGKLPLAGPIHLGKGIVDVELRAPNYVAASKSLTLPGGAKESISLFLQRSPAATVATGTVHSQATTPAEATKAGSSPMAGVGEGGPTATPSSSPTPADEGTAASDHANLRPYAWGAGIAAAAGLAFAILETAVMQSKLDSFNSHTAPSLTDPQMKVQDCMTNNLTSDCRSIRDAYDAAKTRAVVGYVVGGAFAVTSTVLFILSWQSGDRPAGASTAFGCAPALATNGLTCGAHF